jgi:serine/threonine protein phosphatase PrpC
MNIMFGVAQDQNAPHRSYMEDFYRVVPNVGGHFYAGVFDGHNGDEVGFLAASGLHEEPALRDVGLPVEQRLITAFESFDRRICASGTDAGAAAVVALIKPNGEVWLPWAGDSFALLADEKSHKLLTPPHTPADSEEKKRVKAASGRIEDDYVAGPDNGYRIAMTRALGDCSFKKYGVIATPAVVSFTLVPGQRLLLSSDGIYPTSHGIGLHQVANMLMRGQTPQEAANMLVSAAKHNWGSNDNLTAVVIEAFA